MEDGGGWMEGWVGGRVVLASTIKATQRLLTCCRSTIPVWKTSAQTTNANPCVYLTQHFYPCCGQPTVVYPFRMHASLLLASRASTVQEPEGNYELP